jgi:hypothetical protein
VFYLVNSEKTTLNHEMCGSKTFYRQIEINQSLQLCPVLEACMAANNAGKAFYYVLNEAGQEYINETWID